LRASITTGRRSARLDAHEVGVAVLVPVGHHDQRVGARERVVVGLGVVDGAVEPAPGLVQRGRVVGAHRRAAGEQLVDQGERGRLAHVVGLRLEREPHTATRAPRTVPSRAALSFAKVRRFCRSLASSTARSTEQRRADLVGRADERLHVLGKHDPP
jgi:hypothetical protein